MIRQKGRPIPREVKAWLASPDDMPTVLELLGLQVPETCEGYSHAKGILTGKDENAPEDMFICSYPGEAEMVAAYAKKGMTHKAYGWRGIKTERYTYVCYNGYEPGETPHEWLYDSQTDYYEMSPAEIAPDCMDARILGFRKRLREYLDQQGDPFLFRGV